MESLYHIKLTYKVKYDKITPLHMLPYIIVILILLIFSNHWKE